MGWLGAALLVALTLGGCGAAGSRPAASHATSPAPRPGSTPPVMQVVQPIVRPLSPDGAPPAPGFTYDVTAPAPVHLEIPAIHVDTVVGQLGLKADGTVEVPADPGQAGWYAKGPAPGQPGPAVILGHLDSTYGPAVFYRLASLRPGDQVVVGREDGSQVTFAIQRVATFPVDHFPTEDVYGVTTDPVLRLITCGGTFSVVQGRYLSNVVAFAALRR